MAVSETILDLGGTKVEPMKEDVAAIWAAINKGNIGSVENLLKNTDNLEVIQALLSSGVEITAEQRQMIKDKIDALTNKNLKEKDVDVLKSLENQGVDAAGNVLDKKKEEAQKKY